MFMCWLFTMLFASFQVTSHVSFGFVPELWVSVRLRPFVFFVDSFFFLAGSQARWPYPRNLFYLCLLVARSFSMPMPRYLPLAYHAPILLNQAPNPPCPSKPLFGYVTALHSPSYSVVSCRWRWSLFLVGTWIFVGISLLYLVYLNAPIYLVKGGRLGLMPGVLFHSCRPSFRHISVMFPDFAFLTRLGYNGNPLTVHFE